MGMPIQMPDGRTRYYHNVLDFLDDTEDGFQKIIADNKGSFIDPAKIKNSDLLKISEQDIEIDGLPEIPEDESYNLEEEL